MLQEMLQSSKVVTWDSRVGHCGGSNIESWYWKELRHLHDCLIQHLQAVTAMGYEPSASFIISLIQLKVDQNMRFEWQRYTQKVREVPHYDDMLTFLDTRAQALEALVQWIDPNKYQGTQVNKPFQQKTSLLEEAGEICIVCKADKHPL